MELSAHQRELMTGVQKLLQDERDFKYRLQRENVEERNRRMQRSRGYRERLIDQAYKAAGIDANELAALQTQELAHMRSLAQQQKQAIVERSQVRAEQQKVVMQQLGSHQPPPKPLAANIQPGDFFFTGTALAINVSSQPDMNFQYATQPGYEQNIFKGLLDTETTPGSSRTVYIDYFFNLGQLTQPARMYAWSGYNPNGAYLAWAGPNYDPTYAAGQVPQVSITATASLNPWLFAPLGGLPPGTPAYYRGQTVYGEEVTVSNYGPGDLEYGAYTDPTTVEFVPISSLYPTYIPVWPLIFTVNIELDVSGPKGIAQLDLWTGNNFGLNCFGVQGRALPN